MTAKRQAEENNLLKPPHFDAVNIKWFTLVTNHISWPKYHLQQCKTKVQPTAAPYLGIFKMWHISKYLSKQYTLKLNTTHMYLTLCQTFSLRDKREY